MKTTGFYDIARKHPAWSLDVFQLAPQEHRGFRRHWFMKKWLKPRALMEASFSRRIQRSVFHFTLVLYLVCRLVFQFSSRLAATASELSTALLELSVLRLSFIGSSRRNWVHVMCLSNDLSDFIFCTCFFHFNSFHHVDMFNSVFIFLFTEGRRSFNLFLHKEVSWPGSWRILPRR